MADRRAVDPPVWVVVFQPHTENWFVQNLMPGRFKHVAACAHIAALGLWVTYDVGLHGTKIAVIPDGAAVVTILAPWLEGCTLVMMPKDRDARTRLPLFGWCAPSIARLIGIRGITLRPDALYRQCLRNGGTVVDGQADPGPTNPG